MNSRGFTLIELLVVVLIISITLGFAFIAFGDFGESRRIVFAAEQLMNTIELAQQQAIMESSTFGLNLNNEGYQILKFDNAAWRTVPNRGVFSLHHFPKNTQLTLSVVNANGRGSPAIVINASGDMTPFTLRVGTAKQPTLATLIGKHNGSLVLTLGTP